MKGGGIYLNNIQELSVQESTFQENMIQFDGSKSRDEKDDNYIISQGYWRSSVESFDFIKCDEQLESCLGYDKCKKGYKGVLCSQCDYQKNFIKNISGDGNYQRIRAG
ncbi:hypothetical protein PPERSA_12761 [Pseudocohnilembus persalinus]|uniref:DUF7630 domain-containing protein n=1 Tax=Pseudocohnilembus persalinus TaxID=266149 RepID=A0A0V0QTG4_PSEPJ|nr:hypothetical protein PPERSA_12761 [Pseudocohnilembus persalinus]|eukprot:KRX05583.1 hypothetical protein PPERSA_12761 [Pseudocohnilembus persalinus]